MRQRFIVEYGKEGIPNLFVSDLTLADGYSLNVRLRYGQWWRTGHD